MAAEKRCDTLTAAMGRSFGAEYPLAAAGVRSCGARAVSGAGDPYTCTRPAGHGHGPHVAHVPGGDAAAVWFEADGATPRTGRAIVAVVVLLAAALLASTAAAQDVLTIADKSTITTLAYEPLGPETLVPAELDGVASSREWIQYRTTWSGATELRGVALRDGALCTGEWFDPLLVVPARHDGGVTARVVLTAGVDRLVVQGPLTYAEVAIRYGCPR